MVLDIQTYRECENAAKARLPSWRIAQKHNPDVFEKTGCPVRLTSLQQLRCLLDTMQEHRFDAFMQDLVGLAPDELEQLLAACIDVVEFQLVNFPEQQPVLPLSTMISAFSAYRKINSLRPGFRRILEIGPGCGYLSFFLRRHQALANYTQVEACESFYLLQSQINDFLFKERYRSMIWSDSKGGYRSFSPDLPPGYLDSAERPILINPPRRDPLCAHYPWWNLAALAETGGPFEVITANANLLEFSTGALHDYLALIRSMLAEEGIFFVQCFGWGGPGDRRIEGLWQTLYDFGFAPLALLPNFLIDADALLAQIPADCRDIVLAPAGAAVRGLLENRTFTDRFERIILVDGNRAGETITGCEVVAPAALQERNIQTALIVHDDEKLVDFFEKSLYANGVQRVLRAKGKKFAVPYGVFVNNKHSLFDKGYSIENFTMPHLPRGVESVARAFGEQDAVKRRIYTREEIGARVQELISRAR